MQGVHESGRVDAAQVRAPRLGDRRAQQMLEDRALAALLAGLELDLAAQHVDRGLEVDRSRHADLLVLARRAVQGGRGDRLRAGDREPGRYAGALIDGIRFAKVAREPCQHLEQMGGHLGDEVGLLADDGDLLLDRLRVVGADLGAEPVLQRCDDAPAVRVVLGVGGRDDEHVQVETQQVAADLDVALLHHVQERHLNALGEVGQLVDGDDAAVTARDEPVVDRLGVTERAALGDLHRVDVADQVGNRGVGSGELLDVPLGAMAPRDRQFVAQVGRATQRCRRDRVERMLAQFGSGDDRRPLVEQTGKAAQQPRLALPALAQQHDVVSGEQGAFQLRDHRRVESVDAGPRVAAVGERRQEVLSQLDAQRPVGVPRRAQLTGRGDRGWRCCHDQRVGRLRRQWGRMPRFDRVKDPCVSSPPFGAR